MATYRNILLTFLCIFLGSGTLLFAQEEQDTVKQEMKIVVLMDGTERIGQILSDDGREILLETAALGKIYISKSDIKEIKLVLGDELETYNGDVRNTGPFTTRYYFTTNALPVKKREDYAMVHLYGPEVHFSVADRFSVGVMTTWIASPFILATKYSFPSKNEKLHLSLGTLVGTSGYLNKFRGYGGLHWGTVTIGDRMKNLSLSVGYSYLNPGFLNSQPVPGTYIEDESKGYLEADYADVRSGLITAPVVSIAGITKIGKKASFFFDSMIFYYRQDKTVYDQEYFYGSPNSIVVTSNTYTQNGLAMYLMPGMRLQTRANTAFQLALAGVTLIEDINDAEKRNIMTIPIPTCSWFFKF